QFAAAGAGGLEAGKQQRVAVVNTEGGDVMQYPSAGGHAAGGDHHLGVAVGGQRLGFFNIAYISDAVTGGRAFVVGQLVIRLVTVQQLGGAGGHGAVEKHRDAFQASALTQPPQGIDKRLGSAHGKRRDDHGAAALDGALDHRGQGFQ